MRINYGAVFLKTPQIIEFFMRLVIAVNYEALSTTATNEIGRMGWLGPYGGRGGIQLKWGWALPRKNNSAKSIIE